MLQPSKHGEMTTVVVVKKAGLVAIASDTLVTFGDTQLGHRLVGNSKLLHAEGVGEVGTIGVAGSVAHFAVRQAQRPLAIESFQRGG